MRILSLYPPATELVFALGAGHLLVGRTDTCDYPERARTVPSIGLADAATSDMISIFEPTLLLLGPTQNFDCAGVIVFRVAPQSIEEIYALITSLGAMLDKHIEADIIVHELKCTFERVIEKTAKFCMVRVCCCQECSSAEIVPKFVQELITLACGTPFVGEHSVAAIQQFDPQLVLILGAEENLYLFLKNDAWKNISAVLHERVFRIDECLLRPTPRLADGVKLLAKLLHGVDVDAQTVQVNVDAD